MVDYGGIAELVIATGTAIATVGGLYLRRHDDEDKETRDLRRQVEDERDALKREQMQDELARLRKERKRPKDDGMALKWCEI